MPDTTSMGLGRPKILLIVCVALLLPLSAAQAAASAKMSLSATLSSTDFSLDSRATLRIRVNGASSAEIEIPKIDNLIFHEGGKSSEMRLVNSTFSSSITFTYVVEALREGSYTIPPLTVDASGTLLKTEPLSFEVTSSQPSSAGDGIPESGDADDLAFVTVEKVSNQAYTGEVLPVTITAYFLRKIGAEITEPPTLTGDGFVLSPLEAEPQQGVETYQGRTYSVISWQSAITPIRDGLHEFAVEVGAVLQLPQLKRPSRDPLFGDDFFQNDLFDSFFGKIKRQQVSLQSSGQTVSVLPLPEKGRPPGFDGAVGSFDLSVSARPQSVATGEPITLTMTISGRGNFDRVRAPEFQGDDAWKSYSASGEFFSSTTSYTGKKVFDRAVVPKSAAITAIPPVRFSYFDPAKASYITLETDPLPLRVEESDPAESAADPTMPAPEDSAETEEEKPSAPRMQLRLTSGDLKEQIAPLYERNWFWFVAVSCSTVLLVLAMCALARRHRLSNHHKLQQKKLQRQMEAGLASLRLAAEAGDDGAFLQGCRRLISMRLASVWNMQPAAVSLYDLEHRLDGDSPLVDIFRIAQQHAYGGRHLTASQMDSLLMRLKEALEEEP